MPALLLALTIAQLQFVEQRPTPLLPLIHASCRWGDVPVFCQQKCSCIEVVSRLELARTEMQTYWADAPADADWWKGLEGWRIFVTEKKFLTATDGELLYGVVFGDEKRMVLSRDMCGVLHELVHVQQIAMAQDPAPNPHFHPLWERNSAVKEISIRFVNRFRGKPP